jgi:hypothetical protein
MMGRYRLDRDTDQKRSVVNKVTNLQLQINAGDLRFSRR